MSSELQGTISSESSLSRISEHLQKIGVAHIHQSYVDGRVSSLSFQIIHNDEVFTISLPIRFDMVKQTLGYSDDKAYRVGCELLELYVRYAVMNVVSGQMLLPEVFLSHMYDEKSGQTVFEAVIRRKEKWGKKK